MRRMCRGRASASASGAGVSIGRPMIGSTISPNFAGCAVARKSPTCPACPTDAAFSPGSRSRCADRAGSRALVDPPDRLATSSSVYRLPTMSAASRRRRPRTATASARSCSDGRRPSRWRSLHRRPRRERPVGEVCGHDVVGIGRRTKRAIGRPARLAIRPAVRLPKLPLGVQTTHRAPCPVASRHLRERMEVVDHLRQQPADVDRVGRRQPHPPPERRRRRTLARQAMTVVEGAGHGVGADVPVLRVEHRQLRFLRRADASVRIEHDDARVRDAVERVRDGAAGVAGGGGEHRQRLIAGVERGHQPRHHARADVLERERRPVEQLERADARLDFDERDREVQRLDDDRLEARRVELAARVRPQDPVRRSR